MVARVLASATKKMNADIVVCGELSVDGSGGLTGAMLAELSGMPLVDRVTTARFDEDLLLTERRASGGYRVVERTPLAVVLTVATGANVPRYPTLRSRLESRSVEIPCWGVAEVGLDAGDVGQAAATLRTIALRRPLPDPRGLVDPGSDLPPEERWRMAVSGGVQERGSALVEGSPEELAERLLHRLWALTGKGG
jgi:electron transfer flavoprotein beta subunit